MDLSFAADRFMPAALAAQVARFPATRFMGSKARLLEPIWQQVRQFSPDIVLDLCSGSGVVSYMLKAQGCRVIANDYMAMAVVAAEALIENRDTRLSADEIRLVCEARDEGDALVQSIYGDLYYSRDDTIFIDCARTAIRSLPETKRRIAMAALIRACLKRRPRGIFTYTGVRYNDGRRDLRLSLSEHFAHAAALLNAAVFCNGQENRALRENIAVSPPQVEVDLVYLDPPYFSPLSDNEYVRRYHFLEGLACNWTGVEIDYRSKTRKIRNYPTPFRSEAGVLAAFEMLVDVYRPVPFLISYNTNALPTAETIMALLKRHRRNVTVTALDHLYCLGNHGHIVGGPRNRVKELLFAAY